MKQFRLQMTDGNSPNWNFDDEYENIEEVSERVKKTIENWKNDLQKFRVSITRLNK